ncbi:hypothetical protein Tco_0709232 [Tanacetum coccineum]
MANLPPNHNEFAPAAEAAPNNLHDWIEEEEDPEMEEEEDLEMEEEDEEMDAEAEAAPIPPSPIPIDSCAEAEVLEGSSSSSVDVGHDPEDLTLSHIRSDLDALHRRVQKHLPPHLHYQEAPYVLPSSLMVPVTHDDPRDPYVAARDAATAPAIDNDDPAARDETSPFEPQGSPPLSRIDAIGCDDLYHFVKQCNYVLTLLVMNDENGYLLIYYWMLLIMPPKAMSQAAIKRLITQRVNVAVEEERARQVNAGGQGSNASGAGGQGGCQLFESVPLLDL